MPDPRLGYRLVVRMTTADRERIERAAKADQRAMSAWCRKVLLDAAKQTQEE